jgi:hypothetical protein
VPIETRLEEVPPDLGNVLLAVKNGGDVIIRFPLAPSALVRVHRDLDKFSIASTPIAPDAATGIYGDFGAIGAPDSYYYALKGLSMCSAVPGP